MSKYKLNFLRWLTKGKVPDELLKTAINFKSNGDKFSFNMLCVFRPPDWKYTKGSCQ